MSKKRKISTRKVLQSIVTLVLLCGCATAVLSTTKLQKHRKVSGVSISIENSDYGFVNHETIKEQIIREDVQLNKTKLSEVDINSVESKLAENPWIAHAEVYVDNTKEMKVSVVQRVPVVRVFDENGDSYYLDSSAQVVPWSDRYVHYATTVVNVPVLGHDSAQQLVYEKLVKLSRHIDRDSFWSPQVSHVSINEDGDIELMPVLGNHKILIGDIDRLDEKLGQVFKFYTNVLNRIGWDKYDVLDVRYKGQLVASPSIPWNVPKDNIRNTINWVSSITGEAPKPIVSKPQPRSVVEQPATPSEPKQSNDGQRKEQEVKEEKITAPVENAEPLKEEKEINKEKKEPKYLYQGH